MARQLILHHLLTIFLLAAATANAAVIPVGNTNEFGPGSLRAAIDAANAGAGPDVIVFTVSGTILIGTNLPALTDDHTEIHGETNAISLVESGVSGTSIGINVDADSCVVRGLTIDGFDHGIYLTSTSGTGFGNQIGQAGPGLGNTILNCQYGIRIQTFDCDGNVVRGNRVDQSTFTGISIENGADDNVIGGLGLGEGNIVTRTIGNAVQFVTSGSACDGNQVFGNYIGTDPLMTSGLGNAGSGIVLEGLGCTNTLVDGNRIVDCGAFGVDVLDEANQNQIQNNMIGFDTALNSRPNLAGIQIRDEARYNTVGPDNVLSGNLEYGVYVWTDNTHDNLITQNVIGLDPTGSGKLPNGADGIKMAAGPNPIEYNLISGNDHNGINLADIGAVGSNVIGNYIGTDVSGTIGLGNAINGVALADSTHQHFIDENLISDNGGAGIYIGLECDQIHIYRNKIGTDASGSGVLGNAYDGIQMRGHNIKIGGTSASNQGNVIAHNGGSGINASGGGFYSVIQGNEIFGNAQSGVLFGSEAIENMVGAQIRVLSGAANSIHHNGSHGVQVGDGGGTTQGNQILSNEIFENGGEAVELYAALPPGNQSIPAPTILGASTTRVWGTTNLGSLDSVVQIFSTSSDECDSLLAEFDVTTGDYFNVALTISADATLTATNTAQYPSISYPLHSSGPSDPYSLTIGTTEVAYDGLINTALGGARLLPSSGRLKVEDIGSSGQDGVHTRLGDGSGAVVRLNKDPVARPLEMHFEPSATVDGFPETPLGSMSFVENGPTIQINADYSPLGSTSFSAEIYDSGVLQTLLPVATGNFANSADCPVSMGFDLLRPADPDGDGIFESMQEFSIEFSGSTTIDLPGGKVQVNGDMIVLRAVSSFESIDDLAMDLRFARDAGDTVPIEIVALSLSSHQRGFRGLGQAMLEVAAPASAPQKAYPAGWTNDKLHLLNIGSSGEDGVAIYGEPGELALCVDYGAVIPGPDTELSFEAVGSVGGMPDQSLGSTRISASTGKYALCFIWDLKLLGATSSRIELYLDGQQVAAATGVASDLVAESDAAPSTGGFIDLGWIPPLNKSFSDLTAIWKWPMPASVSLLGAPSVMADELRIVPENPAYQYDEIDRLVLRAAGLADGHLVLNVRNELQKPDGGIVHSLGEASLATAGPRFAPSDVLSLANIGSSGQDGVSLSSWDITAAHLAFRWMPLEPVVTMADGVVLATRCGLAPSLNTYLVQFESSGGMVDLSSDASSLGASGFTVQAYDDGVMVGQVMGAPNGMIGMVSEWPRGVVFEVDGTDFLAWLELTPNSIVDLAGNKAPVQADLLRLVPENQTVPADLSEGMNLVASGIDRMLITTSGPSAPTAVPPSARFATTLLPPKPNPFNPRTLLSFELGISGRVRLVVYDAAGRRVRTLVDELLSAGKHRRIWNGMDDRGARVASGVYLVRLAVPGKSESQKVVLLK